MRSAAVRKKLILGLFLSRDSRCLFSSGVGIKQKYLEYVSSKERKLKVIEALEEPYTRVAVPRQLISEEDIKMYQQKFDDEWTGKAILFNVDSSSHIGMKRLFVRQHLQRNVYQGVSEPDRLFTQDNPDKEINAEQLRFDEDLFLTLDSKMTPVVQQLLEQAKQSNQQNRDDIISPMDNEDFQKQMIQLYDVDEPMRFTDRLRDQLKVVGPNFAKLIELATYACNDIYFVGINQYAFRNVLANFLSLKEIKDIFMKSLHYSIRFSQGIQQYQRMARQLIYLDHYDKIYRIQNGEITKKIKLILKQGKPKDLDEQQEQLEEGQEQQLPEMILFAQTPILDSLHDHTIVQDLHKFNFNKKITKDKDNDVEKLEKHAILEVMLGKLWTAKHTNNRYPYLSENYLELSESDKSNVESIFRQNYVKYHGAKQIFFQKKQAHQG